MNILLVDDERRTLQEMEKSVSEAMPTAQIFCIDQDEYVKDVPRIRRSDHLIKPITLEKVQDMLAH